MWNNWAIPVLASILILGTLGILQVVEAQPILVATGTVAATCCGIDDIAIDSSGTGSDGTVYAAQFGDGVSKFTTFPTGLSSFAALSQPVSVAVDSSGNVYVGELSAGKVTKFSSAGAVLASVTHAGGHNTRGIDIDSSGNVFVVFQDPFPHTTGHIIKYTSTLTGGTAFGPATLDHARFIAIDSSDNVYLTETVIGKVTKFSSAGAVISSFTFGVGTNPIGVAVDSSDNFYVSQNVGGGQVTKFTNFPAGASTFLTILPISIKFDSSDNFYAAENTNDINKYELAPPPPEEQAESLIEDVEDLITDDTLNNGQANSFIKKLEGAIKNIEQGDTDGACDKLQSFIDQVNGFVNAGKLEPPESDDLISAATQIKDSIPC